MPLPTVVVGAGIGGLTAALALASRGHEVTLVERRTGFTEAGAGIQLSPNASRLLIRLGLGPALQRAATEPERVVIRRLRSGQEIGTMPLGPVMRERFGSPYWVVHRADLQTLLLDAVRSNPRIRLLLGRDVVGVTEATEGATLTIDRSGGARETLHGAIVIGADGLGSTLRAVLGDRRAPVFRGAVAWRATLAREDVPAEFARNETGLWLGREGHVVHYPIANGKRVNLVAVVARGEPVEGWSAPGDPADLLGRLGQAAAPLRSLLGAAAEWRLWSLFDLPARRMARGRVALLGDAAHPVLPFLAQGGALAIEDAACLAGCLADPETPVEAALAGYAKARLKRVRKVQDHARRNGRVYHASGPLAWARDRVMRRLGPDGMVERYRWLYGEPDGA